MPTKRRYLLEPLNHQHSIDKFSCGNAEIDEYLHTEALADMEKNVARTFVEIDGKKPAANNVAGFFTLRAHALKIREDYFPGWNDATESDTANPQMIEVPLVELMWLARDLQWYKKGMGDTLMVDVMTTVAMAADCIGLIGLHLRSTASGVTLYEDYEFQAFKEHPSYDEFRYILPVGTIRAIAQKAI